MGLRSWILKKFLAEDLQARTALAVRALDDLRDRQATRTGNPAPGGGRDRFDYDREETLRQVVEAWRQNPLARRIVELTSQYVVGGGIGVECRQETTHQFIQRFWRHRLNRMDSRVFEWCDELTRSGELFILITTDSSGMSYLRAVPALDVVEIETAANDLEQETAFLGRDEREWKGWQGGEPAPAGPLPPVMVHYAINRPVGALRGESDLAPLLKWLSRYAAWLEDRARLNRFRYAFLYVVTMTGSSDTERRKRQAEMNLNPPTGGSILVKDESETWEALAPRLEAGEAGEDGLALKKMIAAGAGIPLHYIAEPESSTRTTAESAGGPTHRRYEQRQAYFCWMLADLVRIVLERAAACGRRVNPEAAVEVRAADISARDNAALAAAAAEVVAAFAALRDRGLIDDAELLRLAYRFAGEVVDVEAMLKRAAPPAGGGERAGDKRKEANLWKA